MDTSLPLSRHFIFIVYWVLLTVVLTLGQGLVSRTANIIEHVLFHVSLEATMFTHGTKPCLTSVPEAELG